MIDPTEYLQAQWEDDGIRAWFAEMCEQPGNRNLCPAARGEWFIDADGDSRCKLCQMKAT